jgi:hypothetical protein
MINYIPVDIWRHIFSLKLRDEPLFIFNFTREIIILGEYKKNEFSNMIKDAIIRNYEITNVPFFDFVIYKDYRYAYILECKMFLCNLNILNSILDSHLCNFYNIYENFVIMYLVRNNNLKLLRWIKSNKDCKDKYIFNEDCCSTAIHKNNLEMLRLLRDGNDPCPWNEWSAVCAVINNNLEMLRFMREGNNPCPWDKDCCFAAIYNNNLEILTFLREGNNPCPWDISCFLRAIENNNLEILRFMREGNDPCLWDISCLSLLKNISPEILKYLDDSIIYK